MTTIAFIPLIAYALISSFTPGPATISISSLAMRYGFRQTLRYQAGLTLGVFVMMLAGGLISASLLTGFPALEPILRWVGAAYILYLAYSLLRAGYGFKEKETPPLGLWHGLLLNVTNPKLVVYSVTVFASFLAPTPALAPAASAGASVSGSLAGIALAAAALALVAGASTLTWGLFGAAIKDRLRNPRVARWVNVALALFLVYAAVELTGLVPALG